MTKLEQSFLYLVRLGIGNQIPREAGNSLQLDIDGWRILMALANKQGLSAIVLDGIERCKHPTKYV